MRKFLIWLALRFQSKKTPIPQLIEIGDDLLERITNLKKNPPDKRDVIKWRNEVCSWLTLEQIAMMYDISEHIPPSPSLAYICEDSMRKAKADYPTFTKRAKLYEIMWTYRNNLATAINLPISLKHENDELKKENELLKKQISRILP